MKPMKFKKSLLLHKRTIAHLDSIQMKNAAGGVAETARSCPTVGPGSCQSDCYTDGLHTPCPGWVCPGDTMLDC
jgi:hypothetical protein